MSQQADNAVSPNADLATGWHDDAPILGHIVDESQAGSEWTWGRLWDLRIRLSKISR
jgi:hypothetical protein